MSEIDEPVAWDHEDVLLVLHTQKKLTPFDRFLLGTINCRPKAAALRERFREWNLSEEAIAAWLSHSKVSMGTAVRTDNFQIVLETFDRCFPAVLSRTPVLT